MNIFQPINLAIAIFVLPLVAFAVLALFNRRLPRRGDWLAIAAMGTAVVLAVVILHRAVSGAAEGHPLHQEKRWEWLLLDRHAEALPTTGTEPSQGEKKLIAEASASRLGIGKDGRVRVGILLDGLTAAMLVVVTVISFLVYFYSVGYMKGDVRYGRYYASLALFSTSMLGLVLSDNLLTLYIFWELVGFCSYALIGHWFERKSAADAAMKAFITTRIGDVGMLIAILAIYWDVGSFRYADVFRYVQAGGMSQDVAILGFHGSLRFWAAIGLFFGAMGKSAQFPLHVWLPDAMEGPTPISALIHAATMVAAGVYLVGRLHPFFPPEALIFVAYIGAFTAVMSATIAVVMTDIKKVLAYSTISQLGYMMLGLGVGGVAGGVAAGFVFALFHLTTHAFFKAGLFLGSGSVIHSMHNEQSMLEYGGLARKMPVTFVTFLLFTLALCGFPYLSSGFFTKDGIIAAAVQFGLMHGRHRILGWAAIGAAFLTTFYMFRLIFLTFTGRPRNEELYRHAHESPLVMVLPLVVLAVLSLGFVGSNKSFGLVERKNWFETIVHRPSLADYAVGKAGEAPAERGVEAAPVEEEHLEHKAHNIALRGSLAAFIGGFLVAFLIYYLRVVDPSKIARTFKPIHVFLVNKWYMDHLYHYAVITPYLAVCYLIRLFDTYIIDGIVNFFGWLGRASAWFVGIFDLGVVDGTVNGTAWTTGFAGRILRLTQTGRLRNYIFIVAAGTVCIIILFYGQYILHPKKLEIIMDALRLF